MTRESENTWGTVAAVTIVASVVGGAFLLKQPLETRRPKEQAALFRANPAAEIVPARLWQDPLHAIQSHWNGIVSHRAEHGMRPSPASSPIKLSQLRDYSLSKHNGNSASKTETKESCQSQLRLLVLMRDGPYAEDREDRRRQRYAVISALTKKDYVPKEAERIGYVVEKCFKKSSNGGDCSKDIISNEIGTFLSPKMLIGFEFYEQALEAKKAKVEVGVEAETETKKAENEANKNRSNWKTMVEHSWESILVLWLNSEDFDTCSLQRVSALMAALDRNGPCDTTVLLGPASSGALATMPNDQQAQDKCFEETTKWLQNVQKSEKKRCEGINDYIRQLHILSPRATVPLHWLFARRPEYTPNERRDTKRVDACFRKDLGVCSFNSVVARDDVVLKDILDELLARGLRGKGTSVIGIVSEQDSAYGRLHDDIFEEIACRNGLKVEVREYGYLLGVDGELPPGSPELPNGLRRTNGDETTYDRPIGSSFMATAHREQSFGVAQLDYVRRLADRIANDFVGSDGPVVIGILGSDVYDKLLILQALRERLPKATFFTTDLDARLTDPDVYTWTRNLIVGSAYGLTVEDLKGAGFRDSYQTALYRAVTLALDINKEEDKETAPCPRLFEIGRTGAIDITKHRDGCGEKAYKEVHGAISYHRSRPTFWPQISSVLFVLAPLLALTIYAFLRGRVLHNQRLSFRRKVHYRVAWIGGGSIVVLGPLTWVLKWHGDEPWPFFEGVSSVPTLMLQLTTIVFAYAIIHIAWGRMKQAEHNIHDDLGLPSSSDDSKWTFRDLRVLFQRRKCRTLPCICNLKHDLSGVREFPSKDAKKCWKRYLRYSDWPARLTRISCPFLISALVTLYVFYPYVVSAYPRPGPLITRDLHWWVDSVRMLEILAVLITVFFCSDTLKLGKAILREFSRYDVGGWPKIPRYGRTSQQWQTMELLVRYTESVSPIAVLPFILMLLLLLARNTVFEGWIWQREALLPLAGFALFVLYRALQFQFEALRAKEAILHRLDHYRLQVVGDPKESSRLAIVREQINGIRKGAFVPWTRHPILQSVLLPGASYGILVLLKYLL